MNENAGTTTWSQLTRFPSSFFCVGLVLIWTHLTLLVLSTLLKCKGPLPFSTRTLSHLHLHGLIYSSLNLDITLHVQNWGDHIFNHWSPCFVGLNSGASLCLSEIGWDMTRKLDHFLDHYSFFRFNVYFPAWISLVMNYLKCLGLFCPSWILASSRARFWSLTFQRCVVYPIMFSTECCEKI